MTTVAKLLRSLPNLQGPQQYTAPPGAYGASLYYLAVANLTIAIHNFTLNPGGA